MTDLAVISGTIDLSTRGHLSTISTPQGEVTVIVTRKAVFLPRHGVDEHHYTLPHRINHAAHFLALKSMHIERVIAVNSTGSLNPALRPGMLVVPDDFIFWGPNPTLIEEECRHVTPLLDDRIRAELVSSAQICGAKVHDGGVYWQTWGPRFETRAEIDFMSHVAHIVGMTMASECICAAEANIRYAAICSIDNYANGITQNPLSMDEVLSGARRNESLLKKIIRHIITGKE